jgi:hypothetical protein
LATSRFQADEGSTAQVSAERVECGEDGSEEALGNLARTTRRGAQHGMPQLT